MLAPAAAASAIGATAFVDVRLLRRACRSFAPGRHVTRSRRCEVSAFAFCPVLDASALVGRSNRTHGSSNPHGSQTAARIIYHWHRYRRRQDLRRGADRPRAVAAGHRVGVYKPAASGCRREGETICLATTRWRYGKPPARRASSAGSARRCSPRRWPRIWPRGRGASNSTPDCSAKG